MTPHPLPVPPPTADLIEERLQGLERQIARQRRMIILCVAMLLMLIVALAAADAVVRRNGTLTARQIRLVDENRQLYGQLTNEGGVARLAFNDADATRPAVELGVHKARPYLALVEHGKYRTTIGPDTILLRDAQSAERIRLGLA
jgi:hypothetical protein